MSRKHYIHDCIGMMQTMERCASMPKRSFSIPHPATAPYMIRRIAFTVWNQSLRIDFVIFMI